MNMLGGLYLERFLSAGDCSAPGVVFPPPRVGSRPGIEEGRCASSQEMGRTSSRRRCWDGEHFVVNRRGVIWGHLVQ